MSIIIFESKKYTGVRTTRKKNYIYSFAGWDYQLPNNMPDYDIELNAKWNIINYEINYIIDSDVTNNNPNNYTVNDAVVL